MLRQESKIFFNQYSKLLETPLIKDRIKEIKQTMTLARKVKIANMCPKQAINDLDDI